MIWFFLCNFLTGMYIGWKCKDNIDKLVVKFKNKGEEEIE